MTDREETLAMVGEFLSKVDTIDPKKMRKDKKIENILLGGSKKIAYGKEFKCSSCARPIWLTGQIKKMAENNEGKPTCINCGYLLTKKTLKEKGKLPLKAMFKDDKEKAQEHLRKAIDEELDKKEVYGGS